MSFIYDDENLISQLLIQAIEFEKKLNKQAQVAPNAKTNVEFQNLLNLSDKLVDQLKSQFNPEPKDPNASDIKASSGNGPKIADLNTLGNFLEYMVTNNVTVNNGRVVYAGSEEPPDKKVWLPINAERSVLAIESIDAEGKRTQLHADYYVHKDLIQRYLVNLSSQIPKADEETQKLMKALLGGLMETVNRIFRTKLTPDYKPPVEVFPDNTTLDNVPNPIIPTGAGNVPLLVKDLKSIQTLNAWIEDHNMSLKDAKGNVMTIQKNYDRCAFINALHARATAMANSARPETQKAKEYYVKAMVQIASSVNCTLGGGQSANQNAPAQKLSPQVMARIFTTLPFIDGAIDFNRITTFFTLVEPLIPAVAGQIAEVKQLMTEYAGYLSQSGLRQISLKQNPVQYSHMMQNKQFPGSQMIPSIEVLDKILDGTRAVLDQFSAAYKSNFGNQELKLLGDQIGESQNDDSIYRENAVGLSNLMGTPTSRSM